MTLAEMGLIRLAKEARGRIFAHGFISNRRAANYPTAACYFAMNGPHNSPIEAFYIFINRQKNYKLLSDKAAMVYLNWLANTSHYQDAFLTKDPSTILFHGCQFDVTKDAKLVAGASVLTRAVTEFPNTINMWYAASRHIDKHFALIFSYAMRIQDKEHYELGFRGNSNHSIFHIPHYFTKLDLYNLMHNIVPKFNNKSYAMDEQRTHAPDKYWHDDCIQNQSKMSFFSIATHTIEVETGWNTHFHNVYLFSNLSKDLPIWLQENTT